MAEIIGGKDLTRDPTYVISPSPHDLSVTCYRAQSIIAKCLTNQSIPRITSYLNVKRTTKFAGSTLPQMLTGRSQTTS